MKANDISVGDLITYNNEIYKVLECSHVKPGKGGAYIQCVLKSLSGTKREVRFRSHENIEKPHVETVEFKVLYVTKTKVVLADIDIDIDSNEINISEFSEEQQKLLENKITIECLISKDKIIKCHLPKRIYTKVKSIEHYSSSSVRGIIGNNLSILLPHHIKEGDEILIDTEDMKYIEKK